MINLDEFFTRAQVGFSLSLLALIAVLWFFSKTNVSRVSRSRAGRS